MQGQGVALSREATAYSRNGADQYGKNRKPKKSRKKKVIITIVIVLLVLLAAAGGFAWWYLDKIADNLHEGVDEDALAELTPTQYDKEPFYLLLMGIDTSVERGGADYSTENARSDSMILARIDAPNKKVTMVSLHRDTVVDLGEHGMNKLNAARFYGGPALAIKKVSELAGVPISHYAELNFDAFSDMVDAVGGIEVEVPMEIDDPVLPAHLDAGWQTLYGADALVLCRSRHAYDAYGDGDRYRAANQRMVLGALAKKVLASDFLTIANTVQALSKYVTTDLDLGDIVGLAQLFRGMDPSRDIYSAMEPTTSSFENGGWYEYVDAVPWKAMMERVDQGLPPTEEDEVDSTGTVLATTGAGTIEALGGADADGYTHVPSEAIDDYGVGAPGA